MEACRIEAGRAMTGENTCVHRCTVQRICNLKPYEAVWSHDLNYVAKLTQMSRVFQLRFRSKKCFI